MKVSKMWNSVRGNWRYTYFYLLKDKPRYDPNYSVKTVVKNLSQGITERNEELDFEFQLERSGEISPSLIEYIIKCVERDVTAFRKKLLIQTIEILCLRGEKKDKENILKIFRAYTSNSRGIRDLITDIEFDQKDFKSIMQTAGRSIGDKILTVDVERENQLWKTYKMYVKAAKNFGIDVGKENIVLKKEPEKFYNIMADALKILKNASNKTLRTLLGHDDFDFQDMYQDPDVKRAVSEPKA